MMIQCLSCSANFGSIAPFNSAGVTMGVCVVCCRRLARGEIPLQSLTRNVDCVPPPDEILAVARSDWGLQLEAGVDSWRRTRTEPTLPAVENDHSEGGASPGADRRTTASDAE